MKFKIGDKVKVVKCEILGECCENINKISTITQHKWKRMCLIHIC